MLRQRIITAAWLAPLMLAGLFGLSGGFFALFTAAVVLLAGWEWTNLAAFPIIRQSLRVENKTVFLHCTRLHYIEPCRTV